MNSNKLKLLSKIGSFLEEKVKIEGGNERAVATKDHWEELKSIFSLLVRQKFEPSYDEYYPISLVLVNRSTHEPFKFLPMPLSEYDENSLCKNIEEKMEVAMNNLHYAYENIKSVNMEREITLRELSK